MRSIIVVASLAMLLASCTTPRAVAPQIALPDPDPYLVDDGKGASPCGRGDARLGDDVIVAGVRKDNARDCERQRVVLWNQLWSRTQLDLQSLQQVR